VLNLAHPTLQDAILDPLPPARIQILFLDNLSSLFSGMRESDADAWNKSCLGCSTSGATVSQSSHRPCRKGPEPCAAPPAAKMLPSGPSNYPKTRQGADSQTGAKFIATFVKNRNATGQECPPLEWHFHDCCANGAARIEWKATILKELFRQAIESGLSSASEIATEMGVSKALVSRLANRGGGTGRLARQTRAGVPIVQFGGVLPR